MGDTLSAVLIGCGNRAQTHAQALTQSDAFDLRAVCDLDLEKAEETAETFGVKEVYTEMDKAISTTDPTHISVITPPGIRPVVVGQALDHQPDSLITEKPIADDMEGVRAIESAAESAGSKVTICHQKVFAEEIQAVKQWIGDGRIGEIERFVGSTKLGLADQGSHFLHTIEWLLGENAQSVRALVTGRDRLRGQGQSSHAEPEESTLKVTFPSGAHAFLHHGRESPDVPDRPNYLEYRLDVIGSEGHAQFVLGKSAQMIGTDGTFEDRINVPDFDEDAYMTTRLYDAQAEWVNGAIEAHPSRLGAAAAVHRTLDGAIRSTLGTRTLNPRERPVPVGESSNERLEHFLACRQPLTVSSSLFTDREPESTFEHLSTTGASAVELDAAAHLVDTNPTQINALSKEYGLSVPIVNVEGTELTPSLVESISAIGANTVIDSLNPAEVASLAQEAGLDVAVVPSDGPLDNEAIRETRALVAETKAQLCYSPLQSVAAGASVHSALGTLGEAAGVVRIQDGIPGAPMADQLDKPDNQVPGCGGAIGAKDLLAAVVEHAPLASWTFSLADVSVWSLERRVAAIERALRIVEHNRPT